MKVCLYDNHRARVCQNDRRFFPRFLRFYDLRRLARIVQYYYGVASVATMVPTEIGGPARSGKGGYEMRINVYSQELTGEVAIVEKTDGRGTRHYGVRLFFDGSPRLHNRPDDDDRSAITYWLPDDGSFTRRDMANVFSRASLLASQIPT